MSTLLLLLSCSPAGDLAAPHALLTLGPATFDADGVWIDAGGTPIGVRSGVGMPHRTEGSGAVVFDHPAGVTEWWRPHPDGVEQGWTIAEDPGDLEIVVTVTDAVVSQDAGGLWLTGERGRVRVTGLGATDADGVALPARFLLNDPGFSVVVDDAGARYPIEIDPVYTSATFSWVGAAGDYYGVSVADAGDLDGDGFSDVIIGSIGAAYVYYGSRTGLAATADTTLTGGTYFGASVAGAGDVDGDGYDDVIVGSHGGFTGTGTAYVYHGSAAGLATSPTTTLSADDTGTYFGLTVSGAGDVDGDGYDDVAVAAYYADGVDGRVTVYRGSAAGVSATADTTLSGADEQGLGYGLAGAGDVNGDGYDDLIVGAYLTASRDGAAFVYHGSASGLATTADTSLYGTGTGSLGWAVAGLGDIDADGYDDVAIGSPYDGDGLVDVYHGSSSGIGSSATLTLSAPAGAAAFGYALGGADVNFDGFADLFAGAPNTSSVTGEAYVFEGSSAGLSAVPTTLTGGSAGEAFGGAVSSAGDIDGDGYDDMLVGAEYYSINDGKAYLFRGYTDVPPDRDDDGYGADVDCDDGNAAIHPGATEVCDAEEADEDCANGADDDDPAAEGRVVACTDADLDTFGADCVVTCHPAAGSISDGTDCDDGDAAIHPGAIEVCDPANTDEDCDAVADDLDPDVTGQATVYADEDRDGYGAGEGIALCDTEGRSTVGSDCDDADPAVHPAATEVPDNGVDENCVASDDATVVDDTDVPVEDTGDPPVEEEGCQCGSTSAAPAWGALALVLVVRRRTSTLKS